MILQRLSEHYDRIVKDGQTELAPYGKSVQKVSFCIVLHQDGSLQDFVTEKLGEGKKSYARQLIVPGQSKPPGAGLNPCFLWDSPEYLLGWSADPAKRKRAPEAFKKFKQQHLALEQQIDDPAFTAVCNFLRTWSPEQAEVHSKQLEEIATNFGVFRIAGEQEYVHQKVERPVIEESETDDIVAHCLVSGERGPVARLHEPKIKGVSGAQTSGALLVSFNASAFTSYGKDQSYNAPVGAGTTFRYTNALNHLLDPRQKRRISLGDATITYWADHATVVEDVLSQLFSGPSPDVPEEDKVRVEQAERLLKQLREGTAQTEEKADDRGTKFFILGLSPNASRLSVRLWIEEDASELRDKLGEHVRDLALKGGRDDRQLPAWQIVQATGRAERDKSTGRLKSFDTKAVSPQLAGELARSILTGAPYPQSLLATMVRRIRSDGEVAFARASAIKAVLSRISRQPGANKENSMTPEEELNPQEKSPAYRCGRLFAVLEHAQEESVRVGNPNATLNATIKDRFFGAAAAAPQMILPRLLVLNNHHLRKLEPKVRNGFNLRIGEIMASPFDFPRQLSLKQQGEFIIGYFHQRQDRFKTKEQRDLEKQAKETASA